MMEKVIVSKVLLWLSRSTSKKGITLLDSVSIINLKVGCLELRSEKNRFALLCEFETEKISSIFWV